MKLSKEDQFSSKENKFGFQARFWLAIINSLATQIERLFENLSKEDAEFLLEDYDSECSDDEIEQKFVEKIYYASRTHSQLSQFVQELKNSPYGKDTTIAPIASRASLCVNSAVNKVRPTEPWFAEP